MKHILNDISQEEKSKILEQHRGEIYVSVDNFGKLVNNKLGDVKPLVNEDNLQGGGLGASRDPNTGKKRGTGYFKDDIIRKMKQTYTFDRSKMKTGSDEVDNTSKEYGDLIVSMRGILNNRNIRGPLNVFVTGGASAVGSSSGYDNTALAERRASKLIAQIRKDIPNVNTKFKFVTKPPVIGKATKLNSPEAMAEQFVKVDFDYNEMQVAKQSIESDNTTVAPYIPGVPDLKRDDDDDYLVPRPVKLKRVCIKIPENLVGQYKQKVTEFKKEHGLKSIPYGVYDVK